MIKEFLTVAKTIENGLGNFIQAAEILEMHPSTLSKHIKLLEDELGAPLFERTTRRVSLNDFGRFFLPHAEKMYDSYVECRTAADQYILSAPLALRYGSVVPVAVNNRFMRAMHICEQKYPDCSFQLTEFDNWTLKDMLRGGSLEFIIAYTEKTNNPEFVAYPLESDSLVAIAVEDHPICANDFVTLDMLRNENIIVSPRSSYIGNLVHNACRSAGYTPRVWYADNSNSNLANVVDHNGGVGLMMESSARYLAGSHTKLLPLKPAITLQLCTFYLQEHKLSPIAETFLTELWREDGLSLHRKD